MVVYLVEILAKMSKVVFQTFLIYNTHFQQSAHLEEEIKMVLSREENRSAILVNLPSDPLPDGKSGLGENNKV